MRSHTVPRCGFAPQQNVVVHDVNGCIRSWGKRGLWMGALFGLVGGALLANSPFVIGALPFGIIGTLVLCAAESAIIAGGIGVITAAFSGRGDKLGFERDYLGGHLPATAMGRNDKSPIFDLRAATSSCAAQTRSHGRRQTQRRNVPQNGS